VSVSKLSSHTQAYQADNHQTSAGQLRNGFRHLLQSIQDGNLSAAQRAYDIITQTFPDIFKTLSGKLTNDYKSIGTALAKNDISAARQAVVELQRDLQNIGRTGDLPLSNKNLGGARNQASTANNISGTYNESGDLPVVGGNIDIKV